VVVVVMVAAGARRQASIIIITVVLPMQARYRPPLVLAPSHSHFRRAPKPHSPSTIPPSAHQRRVLAALFPRLDHRHCETLAACRGGQQGWSRVMPINDAIVSIRKDKQFTLLLLRCASAPGRRRLRQFDTCRRNCPRSRSRT
jgi:hypothetical protein